MEAKTYTNRNNARRAGVAAGVPAELVEITVHKNGDEVRFGWKAMEAAAPAADAVVTTPPANTSDDHCPLCNGDPSSQTWSNEGVSCLCHECGKVWSVKTRKEIRPANRAGAAAAGKRTNAPRVEQNGVKRPGPGKCLEVWEYLDQHGNMKPKDLQPVAEAKGWNINNVQIELYQWRKFNGISGRATVTS